MQKESFPSLHFHFSGREMKVEFDFTSNKDRLSNSIQSSHRTTEKKNGQNV